MNPNHFNAEPIRDFQGAKTLIMGDVNSGKTHFTEKLIRAFCRNGAGSHVVVLDLAPEKLAQVGGKMQLQDVVQEVLYLTCPIVAPRLTGKNAADIQHLAETNARAIEPLFDQVLTAKRSIFVINDASLYLQAGRLERLLATIERYNTVVINAYRGDSFAPAPFTDIEKKQVDALADYCDRVIRL